MSIGTNIRLLRKANSLSQIELAQKATISRTYLCECENDKFKPSINTLKRIADALNVTLGHITSESMCVPKNLINKDEEEPLGTRLRLIRKKKKMSQNTVALFSEISRSYYTAIELNKYIPSKKVLKKIARAFNMSYAELTNNKEESSRIQILFDVNKDTITKTILVNNEREYTQIFQKKNNKYVSTMIKDMSGEYSEEFINTINDINSICLNDIIK